MDPPSQSLTRPPVDQSASTSVATMLPGRDPERLVLTDDRLKKHGININENEANIDVTENRNHQPNSNGDHKVTVNAPDLMSYNNDAHDLNEEVVVDTPGNSLTEPSDMSGLDSATSSSERPEQYQSGMNDSQRERSYVDERVDNNPAPKKVFILHFTGDNDTEFQDLICKFASHLVKLDVDITLDLFIKDEFTGNWNIWHEKALEGSDLVLCIITEKFNDHLTGKFSGVKGNVTYNLMDARSHSFIPVFLCSQKFLAYIPTCLQGSSSFCIDYCDLTRHVEDSSEDFQTLYSLLTNQNRRKKPERGKKVILASKENSRFADLKANSDPVKSVRTHNKMFMQLAMNMVAEWEPVGRMLGIGEPKLYSIKRDNPQSVQEQAVQMFQQWLMKNGSRATLGTLATAIYDSGQEYWNLLDIIKKYE
ncbi:uncharacterized protein [Dysidea avara]|uniref:uncharacterized protein n=1 Tax=Dysidea avara TaxID=196820 RepID=UPI003328941E